MKARISTSFEANIYIFSEGIGGRFLKWFEGHDKTSDSSYFSNVELEFDYDDHLDPEEYRSFHVDGMWVFSIPRNPEKDGALILHVYSNAPMQSLAAELPKFLEVLGVDEFELSVPRYERQVLYTLRWLLENSKHENN